MSGKAVAVGAGILAAVVALAFVSKKGHRLTPLVRSLYTRAARHFPFRAPPLIEDRSVANAQSDGRTIRINPVWVEQELAKGCTDEKCTWSFVMGVLAHELAHHAHRVDGLPGGGHAEELCADETAGRVLALEMVPSDDFARILGRLSAYGSDTHPAGWSRVAAIRRGYSAVAYA